MRRPALAGVLTLVFAAPASAAGPAWLEPVSLSGQSASAPAPAIGAAGDAVAVWARQVDSASRVEARVRAPGGGYGDVQALGSPGATTPDVGVAADGTAVAAWAQGAGVAFALRPPGGSFGAAQLLPADSGSGDVTELRVVVSASGDALIAYNRGKAFASIRAAGDMAGAPVALSTGNACELRAAMGAAGLAAVSWRDCGGASSTIHAARRTATGFATADLPAGSAPVVAVDGDNTTVVAWESGNAVRAATAAPGGAFGAAAPLSSSGDVAASPALAAASDGVWAAWRVSPSGRIDASRRPTGAVFGGGEVLSADGVESGPPALAAAADGSVVAGWIRQADSSYRIEAARRAPGGAHFGAAGLVSAAAPATSALRLAADADGNVLAAYVRGGAAAAQTLDAAGPRLSGIEVREAGYALDSYPFAVTATDAWSTVAATAFDFGDGTSAPGPAPAHAYGVGAQGPRTVSITGTDALGNVSTATRPFLVAPPVDRTAPLLTAVKLDATRFRRYRKETPVVARVQRGTRFRYTLSEPAQVNIFFERVLLGRLGGKSCRRTGGRGKRCRLYEPVGLITRAHPVAGPVSTAFSGRIVGRNGPLKVIDIYLKPGRYRATIVASDVNRNIGKPVQLAFTVLR
jgi:hypothetical protein